MQDATKVFARIISVVTTFLSLFVCRADALASPPAVPIEGSEATTITQRVVHTRQSSDADLGELERLLKENPNDYRLHFALARAYEAIGLHQFAEEEDEVCDKAGPEFHKYVLSLFKDLVARRDYAAATTLFRYVERHYPDDPSVLLIGAVILDHQGRFAEAEDNLQKILKSRANIPGVYTFYGYLRMKEDRLAEAEKLFDMELKDRPALEEAIIGKAKIAERHGQYRSALQALAPFYRNDPLRKGMSDSVANCLVRTGLWGPAATPAMFAVAAASKENELKRAKSRLIMLWPRLTPQQRDASLNDVSKYLEVHKDLAHAKHFQFAFADALLKAGYWREAKAQFQDGLKLDPYHAHAYAHIGEIEQLKERDYAKALASYNRALDLTPAEERSEKEFRELIEARVARLKAVIKVNSASVAQRFKSLIHGG